jgi:hypothetical protein
VSRSVSELSAAQQSTSEKILLIMQRTGEGGGFGLLPVVGLLVLSAGLSVALLLQYRKRDHDRKRFV